MASVRFGYGVRVMRLLRLLYSDILLPEARSVQSTFGNRFQ